MTPTTEKVGQVILSEVHRNGHPYLQFDFIGHLDLERAEKAIGEWKARMTSGTKLNLIYDCRKMTGFDTPARKIWQATMSEYNRNIGNIWIVSSNTFILAAAKTMGLLAGYSIRVAKSIDEITS